ncbi:MAG: hypothetical protein A2049_03345 [Elusimicrobia bacterium GWA2_62_23]|nr:MAG: hypothetical protein A2049_03345 [Elusimicrobia bacterium GWA2_62_23]OGR70192.1 MAG: hypothetical protein A2179_02130 [Elusimicrobia bacterium GWC2_63_65]
MEKERAIQCVPVELLERLKALGERLWADKNPASVQLNAILEEFDSDVRTLGHIVKEYETDFEGRLAIKCRDHGRREESLKAEADAAAERLAKLQQTHADSLKKIEELKTMLAARDSELAELRSKTMEDGSELNSRYVVKMQELYDKVNKKELEMLARWEEKNRTLETKIQSIDTEVAAKTKQLGLREKALVEDFNGRKAELIRTFDRIRAELEAREKALAAREKGPQEKI